MDYNIVSKYITFIKREYLRFFNIIFHSKYQKKICEPFIDTYIGVRYYNETDYHNIKDFVDRINKELIIIYEKLKDDNDEEMLKDIVALFAYIVYFDDVYEENDEIIDSLIKDENIHIRKSDNLKEELVNWYVNLKGTINVTEKYISPSIKSIVFIASSSALTGSEFPEYAASKGGVVTYMKNVALRVAKYNATSNSISPGGVITELNDHILKSEELYKAVLDETLLGKWATVEEIAEFTYFVSVINKSMTGEDIFIDNGEKIKSNFIW